MCNVDLAEISFNESILTNLISVCLLAYTNWHLYRAILPVDEDIVNVEIKDEIYERLLSPSVGV